MIGEGSRGANVHVKCDFYVIRSKTPHNQFVVIVISNVDVCRLMKELCLTSQSSNTKEGTCMTTESVNLINVPHPASCFC